MARVTLQTIADEIGVSRMTVSNAFSRPDQLSDELRQRILEVASTLGYAGPDPTARALARGSTGAAGVLLTDSLRYAFTDPVATGFLSAVADELAPTGLALTLLTTIDDASGGTPARDVAIDGAVVYSCWPRSAARDWLLRRKLPLVYVDQEPTAGIPCVNVDDRGGARAAAQHVVELGHRRVAIVTIGPMTGGGSTVDDLARPQRERLAGWTEALTEAGIDPDVVEVRDNDHEDSVAAAAGLLARPEPPTAILCFSDVLALGVVGAARDAGLVVPRDLSVVGFDDSPAARHSDPVLTTVRQDVGEKGRLAAVALRHAIERHRDGDEPDARHELLPTQLVVRGSTAAAPD